MELYSGQNSSVVGADKSKSTPKSPDPTSQQSGVSTQVLLWEMMDLATEDIAPALERAFASGKPACVNVVIEGQAAPNIRMG